jgi:tRNA(Ile)-lysidine synthase
VAATSRRRRLLEPCDRVLVALSGGGDSTALLAAMSALRAAGRFADLRAVHVDHRLRPDSSEDGAFCESLCRRLGVPLERVEVDLAPGNVQDRARAARYAALRTAAARHGATRIATGHTRTDQAETVLLRLLRGAGTRGLAGIPPRRGSVIRPLIDRSRAEVLAFLRDQGLSWREDPTNAAPRFLRNRVRAEVVPLLSRMNPSLERALARTADLLRGDERALWRRALLAGPARGEEPRVALPRLFAEPAAVRRRVVRCLWLRARGRRSGLGAGHVEAVLALCRRGRPGRLALPAGLEARCAYGVLEIRARPASRPAPPEVLIPGPGVYPVPGRSQRLEVSLEPGAAEVAWPLSLRARRPGDRFRPERGRGEKKLKSWLIDRKVPREERDALWVIADPSGRVLWLPDLAARGRAPGLGLRLLPAREER